MQSLTDTALNWYEACKEANKAYEAQKPFSMADLDRVMGPSALAAEGQTKECKALLGPLHILRARLHEASLWQPFGGVNSEVAL